MGLNEVEIGAKVYPRWDQRGEPLKVTTVGPVLVHVDVGGGNIEKIHPDDLVEAKDEVDA